MRNWGFESLFSTPRRRMMSTSCRFVDTSDLQSNIIHKSMLKRHHISKPISADTHIYIYTYIYIYIYIYIWSTWSWAWVNKSEFVVRTMSCNSWICCLPPCLLVKILSLTYTVLQGQVQAEAYRLSILDIKSDQLCRGLSRGRCAFMILYGGHLRLLYWAVCTIPCN